MMNNTQRPLPIRTVRAETERACACFPSMIGLDATRTLSGVCSPHGSFIDAEDADPEVQGEYSQPAEGHMTSNG